ncbi:MAG TPA: type IV secretion system DNA-binding domain-containing protein [Candidatus Limnocylindrales bacterium]|nr:type IV secretion system DNA-binding domain-containing protein [Candidatus Limnocylindrales bacterium]
MMQRILHSRGFVSALLAMVAGAVLYYTHPFPSDQIFLRVTATRAPRAFLSFEYLYNLFLFTTPFLLFSTVLSGFYIFTLKVRHRISPGRLPKYIDPEQRDGLYVVVGEVHNPRKPGPSENPRWLSIPERGLFTGIAIFGAVGTGKTSCCMYPFAEQVLAYKAGEDANRIGGLILEVKGDFCRKVKGILDKHGRGEDYIEISLDSEYRYNPLHNDLDAYALAFSIASLLNNLFGKGKEPFWQQAYTNLVKFIILLHKVAYDYVTLFDVYQCAISPSLLEERIHEAEDIVMGRHSVAIKPDIYGQRAAHLAGLGFIHDAKEDRYLAPATPELRQTLQNKGIGFESRSVLDPSQADPEKLAQLEAVKRWFEDDWRRIEPKLRTSIVEGISVFLSLFDDNPKVKRVFCPKKDCYDPTKNGDQRLGKPLPSFAWLIENGKVCALNFPVGMNPGLAKALGVMMKLDFERATLNRIPAIEAHPERHIRQVLFLCDEYQHFATVGENDPTGDEKFFSLARQPRCISIIATQSISSLKSALPGDSWRTLLQTFRTKIFLALSDDFSAKTASELCGREDQLKVSYNLSESGHDARVSFLTGKAVSHKANITASKSYNTQSDYRFDVKTFTELRNAQSVTVAYDGFNPMPPMFCYLKPYYNDPNKSYFRQLADGQL